MEENIKTPSTPEIVDPALADSENKKSADSPTNNKRKQKLFIIVGITTIVVLAAAVTFFIYNNKKGAYLTNNKATPTPVPVATRSPKPIPHGKVGFAVSQSDKTKPQFGAGEIDPYDPEKNTMQIVKIAVKDTVDVVAVNAILKTDHETSQPVPFTLVEGTPKTGIWQGSWNVTDTYLYTYNLVLNATSSRGISTVEVTLR